MKYKLDYYVRDLERFVGRNKMAMIIAVCFCIVGVFLGVFTVFSSSNGGAFDAGGWFLIVQNVQRGFLGFFLSRLFTFLFLTLMMFLFSARPFLCSLNVLILGVFTFLQARTITLSITYMGFSFLPAAIVSAVPALIAHIIILSALFSSLIKASLYSRCYYRGFGTYLLSLYKENKIILLSLAVAALLEAILFTILTIGVVM